MVSQAGAMDLDQIIRAVTGPEMFAGLQQLAVQERIRHASGEKYIPSTGRPGEGFARQWDQDSHDFAYQAQATVAPAWRNEVTMGSLDAILEHAPGRFIDLVAPRLLLMILAKDDAITPPDTIREAFNRAVVQGACWKSKAATIPFTPAAAPTRRDGPRPSGSPSIW